MSPDELRPLRTGTGIEAVADGAWVLHGQGQSFVVETGAGLLVVDAGPGGAATRAMIAALRTASDRPVLAIAYSHGHIGYNAGVPEWVAHAASRGESPPRLVAHRHLPRRYARYRETAALQERLAELQFRRPPGSFQLVMHEPEELFDERLDLGTAQLLWAPSETDDAIAVWCSDRGVLYGGPATLDSIPNVGTPLRTLRDPVRWAASLEGLAALGATTLVREFGAPVRGAAAVRHVLLHTARALRWLRAETVRLLNQGLDEAAILAAMAYPPELFDVPWMRPIYGDPSFVVRDVIRSESGWWDRNATTLHPAAPRAVAMARGQAIADKGAVLAAARAHAQAGELQLALHVIDLLVLADGPEPEFAVARQLKADWLRERADQVRSYVSRSLMRGAADALEGRPSTLLRPLSVLEQPT